MRIKNVENMIEYVKKYKDNSKKMIKFKQKFDKYLELCDEDNILGFIEEVKNMPELEGSYDFFIYRICVKFGLKIMYKLTKEMDFLERYQLVSGVDRWEDYTVKDFIEYLSYNGETDYISNHMDEIINCLNLPGLIGSKILAKLKSIDSEKFKELHSDIVCKMTRIKKEYIDETLLYGMTSIVDEIAKNEETDLSKLEFLGFGSFSDVYKLGNKVIKFGNNRLNDKIPYHRRILQPLIRRRILSDETDLYMEIAEYIPYNSKITKEDVYKIYKELREDGIVWLDPKEENLGRLQKDNIAHFKEPLYVKNETVGFLPETIKQDEPLKQGDLIIIDTDFLYRENDFNIEEIDRRANTDFYKKCEQRYQEELKSENNTPKNIESNNKEER